MKANESLRNQHFEISIYKLIWLTFLGHKITKHFFSMDQMPAKA